MYKSLEKTILTAVYSFNKAFSMALTFNNRGMIKSNNLDLLGFSVLSNDIDMTTKSNTFLIRLEYKKAGSTQ